MSLTFDHAYCFFQSGQPITVSDLDALELAAKAVLPKDYKDFLLKVNGGSLRPFAFELDVPGSDFKERVQSLNNLYEVKEIHHRSQLWMDPALRNIPPGRLAIGSTVSELTLTLNLGPTGQGQVEVWVRDTFNLWGEGANRTILPLAASFTDFLGLLRGDMPEAYDVWRWAGYDKSSGSVTSITLL